MAPSSTSFNPCSISLSPTSFSRHLLLSFCSSSSHCPPCPSFLNVCVGVCVWRMDTTTAMASLPQVESASVSIRPPHTWLSGFLGGGDFFIFFSFLPSQEFRFSLLYFPFLSPLFSRRSSDLDRDFWNNNDNTVQQKWSSYPPKEFILNISPYAPYGDPRLSLK